MKRFFSVFLLATMGFSFIGATQESPKPPKLAATRTNDFDLVGVGDLRLISPTNWQSLMTRGMQFGISVDDIQFHGPSTNEFAVVVSAIHLTEEKVRATDIRVTLTAGAKPELGQAIERKLDVHDFGSGEVTGCYFTLTDSSVSETNPKPGEYRYLTQGTAKLGSLILNFRVVSNRPNGSERAETLEMIKAATIIKKK